MVEPETEKYSILNNDHLKELLNKREWNSISDELEKLSKAVIDNRKAVNPDIMELMIEVLQNAHPHITNKPVIQAVAKCFRVLRNSCVEEKKNQNTLASRTTAIEDTCFIIKTLLPLPAETDNIFCIMSGVQFLGNLVVNNTVNQKCVWNTCSAVLMDLLKYKDDRVTNYTSMVMYNILLGCPDLNLEHGTQILKVLIDHAMKDSEFALFTVELLLHREGYLENVYSQIEGDHRLFLLEVVHSLISMNGEKSDRPSISIPRSLITFLAQEFKQRSDCILKTCTIYAEHLEPTEVAKLLDLIASASGDSPYLEELQKDKSLLINCTFLLKNIHLLGKTSKNCFSTIQKLSELSTGSKSEALEQHPAFGFKGSLVRLLGNLCWKHLENQNEVRELDAIPLLLDCCNIDARNPLIIQWVVLAMRNLCESNLENQAVVAAMTRQGTVDSAVLQELGLTLHNDAGKSIGIVPLSQ